MTRMTATTPDAFADRVLESARGAFEILTMYIGVRLGYYDALEALLSALERVEGSNVRAGLLLALRQGDVELPDGRVTLDANRQAVRDGYLARVMWRDGKSALVPVAIVPKVEQTYGGLLSEAPPPGPGMQPCVKGRPPAWAR